MKLDNFTISFYWDSNREFAPGYMLIAEHTYRGHSMHVAFPKDEPITWEELQGYLPAFKLGFERGQKRSDAQHAEEDALAEDQIKRMKET